MEADQKTEIPEHKRFSKETNSAQTKMKNIHPQTESERLTNVQTRRLRWHFVLLFSLKNGK